MLRIPEFDIGHMILDTGYRILDTDTEKSTEYKTSSMRSRIKNTRLAL